MWLDPCVVSFGFARSPFSITCLFVRRSPCPPPRSHCATNDDQEQGWTNQQFGHARPERDLGDKGIAGAVATQFCLQGVGRRKVG